VVEIEIRAVPLDEHDRKPARHGELGAAVVAAQRCHLWRRRSGGVQVPYAQGNPLQAAALARPHGVEERQLAELGVTPTRLNASVF
jgi:uncharacterized protein YbjT (DUF2867 family)